MAQREENLDPASDEKQRMLQKTLQENSGDHQLQLLLENSETMQLLVIILEENEDILHAILRDEEIMQQLQPQREFDKGLWPGMQYLFEKTLTKTDVKIFLLIKLEAYGEMKMSDPSMKFHKISRKMRYERSGITVHILDEELRWWEMKLVCAGNVLNQQHYELKWINFVKVHKPRKGDKIHFYKLSKLENKFGIVIEKAV